MSIEQEIRDAFTRHAGDVRADPAALRDLEGVAARRRTRDRVLGGLAAAAAIVALALIVPSFVRGPGDDGFASGGEPDPPRTTATATPLELQAYRDEMMNVALRYPREWQASRFEGHTTFAPRDPGSEMPRSGFEVWVDTGEASEPFDRGVAFERLTVAGRDAIRYETAHLEDGSRIVIQVDWTGLWCGPYAPCPPVEGPSRLMLIAFASDPATWEQVRPFALGILDTVEVAESADATGDEVRTRNGRVHASVRYDGQTATLAEFLDRRVEGGGAEELLGTGEARACPDPEHSILYTDCGGSGLVRFEVLARAEEDGGRTRYEVSFTTAAGDMFPEYVTVAQPDPSEPPRIVEFGVWD